MARGRVDVEARDRFVTVWLEQVSRVALVLVIGVGWFTIETVMKGEVRGAIVSTLAFLLVFTVASLVKAFLVWRGGSWKVSWERSVKLASQWVPRKSELPDSGRRVAVVLSGDFRGMYAEVLLEEDDWFVTYYRQKRGGWDAVDFGGPYSTGEVGEVSRRGGFEYLPDGPYLLTILAEIDAFG